MPRAEKNNWGSEPRRRKCDFYGRKEKKQVGFMGKNESILKYSCVDQIDENVILKGEM